MQTENLNIAFLNLVSGYYTMKIGDLLNIFIFYNGIAKPTTVK